MSNYCYSLIYNPVTKIRSTVPLAVFVAPSAAAVIVTPPNPNTNGIFTVVLPPAGTSDECLVRLVTPVRTGHASLHLGIYYQNNLVQSYRVTACVAPNEGQMPEGAGDGWWAECEYTLSADLTNLDDLSERHAAAVKRAGDNGAKVVASYAVSGHYDFVVILDAPDMQTALNVLTREAEHGNVRYQTLQAFPMTDFSKMMKQ